MVKIILMAIIIYFDADISSILLIGVILIIVLKPNFINKERPWLWVKSRSGISMPDLLYSLLILVLPDLQGSL